MFQNFDQYDHKYSVKVLDYFLFFMTSCWISDVVMAKTADKRIKDINHFIFCLGRTIIICLVNVGKIEILKLDVNPGRLFHLVSSLTLV